MSTIQSTWSGKCITSLPLVADNPTHRVGVLELDIDLHVLRGPQGAIRLGPLYFALTKQLMQRPDGLISRTQLLRALYPDPDDEPGTADGVLRNMLS